MDNERGQLFSTSLQKSDTLQRKVCEMFDFEIKKIEYKLSFVTYNFFLRRRNKKDIFFHN
jgi:hypothetical protein